jgi:hypothetical protein
MEMDPSKSDLYVCEPSSSISHQFMSTSSVEQSSSSGFCPSSSSTSSNEKYTREKIQYLLKPVKLNMLFLVIELIKTYLFAGVYLVFPPRSIQMVFHTN